MLPELSVDEILEKIKRGQFASVVHLFYTYGDEELLRPWVIDVLERYAIHVIEVALSTAHPALDNWVSVWNTLSAREAQEYKRRNPVSLTAQVMKP